MTRFSAATLAPSYVDKTKLFPSITFANIKAERIAEMKRRYEAAGIPFDVDQLESDPSVILQRVGAGREELVRQEIRDTALNLLLPFSKGSWLDAKGFERGVARAVIVPATDSAPAVMETDDDYRVRIQLAPEVYSNAGTPAGYLFHVLSAAPGQFRDVGIAVKNKGRMDVRVEISLLANTETGEPSAQLLRTVRSKLAEGDVRLATDDVWIRPARPVTYAVTARLRLSRGISSSEAVAIAANAKAAVEAKAFEYLRLRDGVPRDALTAALRVAGVDSAVLLSPAQDVTTLEFQYGRLSGTAIETEVPRD